MKIVVRTLLGTSLTVIALPILIGCLTTTNSGETRGAATFCEVAKPITYSTRDTPETVSQILSHNAAWRELCQKAPLPE